MPLPPPALALSNLTLTPYSQRREICEIVFLFYLFTDEMPPKKGKKGKGGKDDDWGDDKEVEEKLKKLLVADEEAGEF